MVCTHRAHVDGFHAAHTTIVFQLNAREIAHGIGHRTGRQALQLLAVELLRRDDLAEGELRRNNHLPDVLHRVHASRGLTHTTDRLRQHRSKGNGYA